jgi:surface protein
MTVWAIKQGSCVNYFAYETLKIVIEVKRLLLYVSLLKNITLPRGFTMSYENNEENMSNEKIKRAHEALKAFVERRSLERAHEALIAFVEKHSLERKRKKIEEQAQESVRSYVENYLRKKEFEDNQIPYEKIIDDFWARHAAEINNQNDQEKIRELFAKDLAELIPELLVREKKIVVRNKQQLDTIVYATIREKGYECNLNFIDVSQVTDMSGLFKGSPFNGDISEWNVSNVTTMNYMFSHSQFTGENGGIGNWNVSSVNYMDYMFEKCPFNGNVSKWNVSNVVSMKGMFQTTIFNRDLSSWQVFNVENMEFMFCESLFQGNLSEWDVSNVKNMCAMFGASVFNGDLSKWDVSNVTNMHLMFASSKYNKDISNWDVSNVENMSQMFEESVFEQNISNWKISEYTNIVDMFKNSLLAKNNQMPFFEKFDVSGKKIVAKSRTHLNGLIYLAIEKYGLTADLNFIDVSNVTDMSRLFEGEILRLNEWKHNSFNGDISKWDVSSVTNMESMFSHSDFTGENGDIGQWNVSNVTNMLCMFSDSLFKGNLNQWKISLQAYKSYHFILNKYPKRMQPSIKRYFANDSNIYDIVTEAIKILGKSADLNFIDVSNVTDMRELFKDSQFNGDISKWDVSNVRNMSKMFCGSAFDGDLSIWNISRDTDTTDMFANSKYTEKNSPEH